MDFSIKDFLPPIEEETVEEPLDASFADEPPKARRYSEQEWSDLQQARQRYLQEWEEDMRYAQELASEGM